jgi:hypothetical protein
MMMLTSDLWMDGFDDLRHIGPIEWRAAWDRPVRPVLMMSTSDAWWLLRLAVDLLPQVKPEVVSRMDLHQRRAWWWNDQSIGHRSDHLT